MSDVIEQPVKKRMGRPRRVVEEVIDQAIADIPVKKLEQNEVSRVETDARIDDLTKKVDMIVDVVSNLADKVLKTPEKKQEYQELSEEKLDEELSELVPKSWKRIVDDILGDNFEVKVEDSDSGNFILFVYLPHELDRRVGLEKDIKTKDFSTGLVRRASASSDVEYWCEKIKANIQKTYSNFKK